MKVKVIYRNYIPLYSAYCSFWLDEIPGVEIEIPPVKSNLKTLYKVYRKISKFPLVPQLVAFSQKYLFPVGEDKNDGAAAPDLLFYTGILPERDVTTPYIIDFEHIFSLFNYTAPTESSKKEVAEILLGKKCKKILPWSLAAQKTMTDLFPQHASELLAKAEILYPAYPNYSQVYLNGKNEIYVKPGKKLKLLFVGKEYKRKGLIEVLESLRGIDPGTIELHCVSNMPKSEQEKYSDLPVIFYDAKFSQEDVVRSFFMTCDLFIMPTHEDTFGVVFLEALSAGIPVITTKQFASPEFIRDHENGFFVESDILFLDRSVIPDKYENGNSYSGVEEKLVNSIRSVLSTIVGNPSLINGMKESCIKDFESGGKFSIEKRSAQLEKIFKSYGPSNED